MLKRRSFLLGAGSLTLGQLMVGCNSQQRESLKLQLLQGSIPAQLKGRFRQQLKQAASLNFVPEKQLQFILQDLQTWKKQNQAQEPSTQEQSPLDFLGNFLNLITRGRKSEFVDLITLGDFWLAEAIQQKWIQPLEVEKLAEWQQLPPRWQKLVRRNQVGELDNQGQVWGAPYRWGSTVMVYRREQFESLGWTPTDWQDLWREELRDRISLLDQPREVIGLTLKKLGLSYNTTDLSAVPYLREELQALNQQVKFYSSEHYLQPLYLGDIWLAVGWSHDVIPMLERDRQLKAVVPSSGTALWADLWVKPATRDNLSVLAQQWIDFCWQFDTAEAISVLTNATSPILTAVSPSQLPKTLVDNSLRLPNRAILDKSEFLNPLPESTVKQYQDLWQAIRFRF
ncbi:MAG: extracellular solute-binding protein [Symploca sp. SIO2E6]|nr:extracellular solute-binding protein [Symploca sp. SIO2E6]